MLFLMGLSLFTAPTVFAQYAEDKNVYEDEGEGIQSDPNAMSRILLMLRGGLVQNRDFIRRESENVSLEDRQILYSTHRKGTFGYIVLNTLLGYGVGSFVQGSPAMGIPLLLMDLGATGLIVSSVVVTDSQNDDMLTLGVGLYACATILGVIMPIVYTHKYNRTLKGALRLDEPASISMRPLILDNGAVGMTVALNY